MKMLFAGSFDPFTIGHESIVERALPLCDKLVIGIGYNEKKPYEWTVLQRKDAISDLFRDNNKIEVRIYEGLTATFAKEIGADCLLRGVRTVQDFEYERNLADINKEILDIETVFLISEPSYSFISSSMVRELLHNGYDVTKYIAGEFPLSMGKTL